MEDPASQDRSGHQPGDSSASDLLIAQIERENRQLGDALLVAEAELAGACQLQVDFDELRLAAAELERAHADLNRRYAELTAERDQLVAVNNELLARARVVNEPSSGTLTTPLRRAVSAVRGRSRQR